MSHGVVGKDFTILSLKALQDITLSVGDLSLLASAFMALGIDHQNVSTRRHRTGSSACYAVPFSYALMRVLLGVSPVVIQRMMSSELIT